MEANSLARGYESKIMHLSSQITNLKRQNQQLTIENVRVSSLLADSNSLIGEKDCKLEEKQNMCYSLEKANRELQILLQKSQRHRKILFDQLNTDMPDHGEPNIFLHDLYNLNRKFSDSTLWELQEVIVGRNKQISRLSKQYNDLRHQHLKLTSEFYVKLTKLTEENEMLKANELRMKEINTKLQNKEWRASTEQTLLIKTLNERITILEEKIKADTAKISNLNTQLTQANRKQVINKEVEKFVEPEVEAYLQMVAENKKLRKEVQQYRERYCNQGEDGENIAYKQENFMKVMEEYRQAKIKLEEVEIWKLRLETAEDEAKNRQKIMNRVAKRMEEKETVFEKSRQHYKSILLKFKQFFQMVNPHFEIYEYSQLNLSAEEQQIMASEIILTEDSKNRLTLAQTKQKFYILEQKYKQKAEQTYKFDNLLQQKIKQLFQLKEFNEKLVENIKKKEQGPSMGSHDKFLAHLMEAYTHMQEERNKLTLQVRDKEFKIIQLLGEICELKTRRQRNALNSEKIDNVFNQLSLRIAESRPEIRWVQLHGDVESVKQSIAEMEVKLLKQSQNHSLEIQQQHQKHLSEVFKLKDTIMQLEEENARLMKKQANVPVETSNMPIAEPMIQQSGTILELEEKHSEHEEMEGQNNILTPETIEEMSSILKTHENSTKSLVEAYSELKRKFTKLQEEAKQKQEDHDLSGIQSQLEEYSQLIKSMKIRLEESDRNLVLLENQLHQKQDELEETKEQARKQKSSYTKYIAELQKQLEQSQKQNWMQSDSPLQVKQKQYFPQELEYLLQQIMTQKTKIQKTNNQANNQQNQSKSEKNDDLESKWQQPEWKEICELIKSGRVLEVLTNAQKVMEMFRNQSDEDKDII